MWVSPSLCSNLPPQSCHQVYLLCKLNNQQSPNTLSPKLPVILAALFTLFPIHLSHVNTQHPSKNSAQAETCHMLAGSEEKIKNKKHQTNKYNKVLGAVHELATCSQYVDIQQQSWCTSEGRLCPLSHQSHLSLPC